VRRWVGAAAGLTGLAALLGAAGTATATPPGINGNIAFEGLRSTPGNIWSMGPTGLNQTRLTFDPAEETDPAYSPDGTRIAFSSSRDGQAEIYVMNQDGTGLRRFTIDGGADIDPTWSPDGTRIAWASDRSGNFELYAANVADGGGLQQLTLNVSPDVNPEWSPGGTTIAFESNRTGGGDIYRLSPTGTEVNVQRLTDDPTSDTSPTWAPDSSRIAFSSARTGGGDIYSIGNTGIETDLRRHTNDPGVDELPSWSPDGTRLAFDSSRGGGTKHIWTVGSSGTETSPLQITSTVSADVSPAWQTVAPAPAISTLTPASSGAGSPGIQLTVDGSGFVRRSVIRWNGSDRPTTFVSATRLQATIPASDLAAAGTAQVAVFTSPVGGGLSATAPFTVSPTPAPPLVVTRAEIQPKWRTSRLLGKLELAASITRPARLRVRLLRASGKGKPFVTRQIRVTKAGPFVRRLTLVPKLLPGRYLVRVSEIGGGGLPTVDAAVRLKPPREGVVSRAVITNRLTGGPAVKVIKGRPSIIFAFFTFAAQPAKGAKGKLTVSWFAPGSRRPVQVRNRPRSTRVSIFLKSGFALPLGSYRAELRLGKTLVAVARVRLA
jgi:Tol biopolymer transport system component